MSESDIARVPDPPEPIRRPKRVHLRLEALEGLSIGVPARVKALVAADGILPLQPGPCQSDHPLAPVLDSIGGSASIEPATIDPSFPFDRSEDETR
jgi:hypothetical protein